MATTLEELVFKFEADLSSLKAGLTSAQASVDRLEKGVKKSADKMGAALGGMGRLFKLDLLIRYGQQLIQVEDQMERLASQIRDTADRADIGVEALQRLRHAADQNGTSAEAMDSALIRLNKAMGLARSGAEGMDKIFAALGLGDLIAKGAKTETMFLGLTDAVAKMTDEAQASAIMSRIMGREADRLIELMKQGAPEVRRLGLELSRVISEETVNKLDTSRDKTEEFKKVVNSFASDASALAITLGHDLVNSLKSMFEWVEKNTGAMTALAAVANIGDSAFGQSFKAGPASRSKDLLTGFRSQFMSKPAPAEALPTAKPDQAALDKLFGGGSGGDEANAAAKAAERYRQVLADLKFELDLLGKSEAEVAMQQSLRNALSSAGVTLESQRGQEIAKVVAETQRLKAANDNLAASWEVEAANANRAIAEMHENMREVAAEWAQIGGTIEDKFANAFVDMAMDMESAGEQAAALAVEIGKLIAKTLLLKAIEEGVNAAFGTTGGGNVGGFAAGGTLNPGNPYIVHKNEMVIPRVPMSVVPAGRGAGGMSVVYSPTINAQNGVTRSEMQAALAQDKAEFRRLVPGIVKEQHARGRLRFG